jgi:hypothetical protein
MSHSYQKAIGHQNWARDSESMQKHNNMQTNLKRQSKSDLLDFHFLISISSNPVFKKSQR